MLDIMDKLQDSNIKIIKNLQKTFDNLGLGLTPIQSRILFVIRDTNDKICQKDLENSMCRNKSTMSSILDTMEKNGYINRTDSESDSRKKIIKLTEKANDILSILDAKKEQIDKCVSQGISQDEYNIFCRVLEKINNNIERI